jgi:hypothetical protein
MAKETIRLIRTDNEDGSVQIDAEILNGRYTVETFQTVADFLGQRREWVNDNIQAAGRLAMQCYLAVDPTGEDPALLNDVVTEIDPQALTIVRRAAV